MKKLVPVVLVLAVLAIGGWMFFSSKKTAVAPVEKKSEVADSVTGEKTGIVSSIKDAMGLGQTMQCTYSGPEGTSTVFVDGEKFKTVAEASGSKMTVLYDGKTQYYWDNATKQGFSISMACLEELNKSLPETEQQGSSEGQLENFKSDLETVDNAQCAEAKGIDFTVPADVVFTDQCAVLKQAAQVMQGIEGQLPKGFEIPGY